MKHWFAAIVAALLCVAAATAHAAFHLYRIEQVYSNASGTVQFVVLTTNSDGEHMWAGKTFTSTHAGSTNSFTFPANLPSSSTAGRRVLIATHGFAALGIVTPDYLIPNGFMATDGGTINYAGADQITYLALPTDGTNAINRNGTIIPNVATNFAGASGSVTGETPSPGLLKMPAPIVFGSQSVGTQSSAIAVTVVNIGGTPVTIAGVASSNAAEFGVASTTCTGSIVSAGTCQIRVVFMPAATGARNGTIVVTSSGVGSPQSFAVSGTGTAAPAPGQLQMPAPIVFGSQTVGTQSAPVSANVVNIGGTAVAISGVASGNPAEFAIVSTTCPGNVAAGANCQISVAFQPTAAGARNGTIVVTSSGLGSPQSFAVSGTGIAVAPGQLQMPGPIALGSQPVGTPVGPVSVDIVNIGGSAVTVVGVASSNPAELAIATTNCTGAVAAGAGCQIGIAFHPTAAGEREGTITVTSSGVGSPQSFAVYGVGSDYSRDYVQKAYVAYYGRAADPDGLDFWANKMDEMGKSLDKIIEAFGTSAEFTDRYGGLTDVELVTKIYQQALGRDPDPGGLDYYVGELKAGHKTLQTITLDVLNGATTPPDSTVVVNKLDVAAHHTAKVAAGCPYGTEQDGVDALAGVTDDFATVIAARAAIDTRCGP